MKDCQQSPEFRRAVEAVIAPDRSEHDLSILIRRPADDVTETREGASHVVVSLGAGSTIILNQDGTYTVTS